MPLIERIGFLLRYFFHVSNEDYPRLQTIKEFSGSARSDTTRVSDRLCTGHSLRHLYALFYRSALSYTQLTFVFLHALRMTVRVTSILNQ